MMNQFACWRLNGERIIVCAHPDNHYDFMMGYWRIVARLPTRGSIRILTNESKNANQG